MALSGSFLLERRNTNCVPPKDCEDCVVEFKAHILMAFLTCFLAQTRHIVFQPLPSKNTWYLDGTGAFPPGRRAQDHVWTSQNVLRPAIDSRPRLPPNVVRRFCRRSPGPRVHTVHLTLDRLVLCTSKSPVKRKGLGSVPHIFWANVFQTFGGANQKGNCKCLFRPV